MNKCYLLAVVLLIFVGGYFVFVSTSNDDTNETSIDVATIAVSLTGVVLGVDQSELAFDGPTRITVVSADDVEHSIAVPSMGINLCEGIDNIAGVSNIAVGDVVTVRGTRDESGAIVPCANAKDELVVVTKASDSVFEYEFSYRKGPNGYITLEDTGSEHKDFVTGLILFNEDEYKAFSESVDAREGPPAMRLRVYQNPNKLHSSVWVMRNQNEVNAHLMLGSEEETVVGGANAVYFVTDGLYTTEVYVIAHGKHVYVLMGDSFDPASAIRTDFESLVVSFTFIEASVQSPQGKIDPRAACESALMYMSFENGTASDAFVADCVAGKHPEVIERYISDMGVDGATI